MGLIVNKSDFIGRYALAISVSDTIDSYIELYEEPYLIDMMGYDLFQLFKTNLIAGSGTPTDPFLVIFNAFYKTNQCIDYSSKGIKDMLLGFIFWEYVRGEKVQQGMNGAVAIDTDTASNVSMTFLYRFYNDAIKSYSAIQYYLLLNKDVDYPEFAGQQKNIAWAV